MVEIESEPVSELVRYDANDTLNYKGWYISWRELCFGYNGSVSHLRPDELRILELLISNSGKVVTHRQIIHHLRTKAAPKIVDVYLCHIRKKLVKMIGGEDMPIVSVWGRGTYVKDPNQTPIPTRPILPADAKLSSVTRWTPTLKREICIAVNSGRLQKSQLLLDNQMSEEEFNEWSK